MDTIVISLGGSTLMTDDGALDTKFMSEFADMIKKHAGTGTKFVIVVGGGYTSRKYIDAAAHFTESNYIKDNIGIESTYLNSWLLRAVFGESAEVFRGDFNSVRQFLSSKSIVITGGIIPGISTDTVAMLIAEATEATHLINVSTPKGIYDENGSFMSELKIDDLIKIAMEKDERTARSNFIFDVIACKIAKRSKTELHFIDKGISSIEAAVLRQAHHGTVVKSQ
ncbi:hypothetical protein M1373_01325 [Candidatus Marsarchaeota archaeon]|nr:hypothetical protein [Candidatus Marsarchaeota archaeon]MCL5404939.1 hypothetical protein [Candidatus Marsarchaeota archaeon]